MVHILSLSIYIYSIHIYWDYNNGPLTLRVQSTIIFVGDPEFLYRAF